LKYYHGDYLQQSYRDKRQTRLTPAPDGGAMADLGSHGISLLMAFMGENLQITSAIQAGRFADVPEDSDLFSSLSLVHPDNFAAGSMSASRISSGTGDLVSVVSPAGRCSPAQRWQQLHSGNEFSFGPCSSRLVAFNDSCALYISHR